MAQEVCHLLLARWLKKVGFIVNLEKVPLKYQGLYPWEIWVSESQERMTLAVHPSKIKKVIDRFNKRGVEATLIGKFIKEKSYS